jgi:hypothetical protein
MECASAKVYLSKQTKATWQQCANEFASRWNFPNCCGAIDGKHVVIKAPAKSGSQYFNYKGTYSIVLLAVVDANYKFVVIDVGSYGRSSDGGIFAKSHFGFNLTHGKLDLPANCDLPVVGNMPHVFVADEAFPLLPNLMRPYPGRGITPTQRVFNYRLSRARRVVENAFGILASRFRFYHRVAEQGPNTIDKMVKASVLLHNFLQSKHVVSSNAVPDGEPCDDIAGLQQMQCLRGYRASSQSFDIRNRYKDYFNSNEGRVYWQDSLLYTALLSITVAALRSKLTE